MTEFRTESDTMGTIDVPSSHYWGAQTQRSLHHFEIGHDTMPPALIRAFGVLKLASARVNAALGKLSNDKADLIERAAREVADGVLMSEFPLRIWQTGSGTQTNMNVNEVIANRALVLLGEAPGRSDLISPLDDVNRCQSTNDTYPTALRLAAIRALGEFKRRWPHALEKVISARHPIDNFRELLTGKATGIKNVLAFGK